MGRPKETQEEERKNLEEACSTLNKHYSIQVF